MLNCSAATCKASNCCFRRPISFTANISVTYLPFRPYFALLASLLRMPDDKYSINSLVRCCLRWPIHNVSGCIFYGHNMLLKQIVIALIRFPSFLTSKRAVLPHAGRYSNKVETFLDSRGQLEDALFELPSVKSQNCIYICDFRITMLLIVTFIIVKVSIISIDNNDLSLSINSSKYYVLFYLILKFMCKVVQY